MSALIVIALFGLFSQQPPDSPGVIEGTVTRSSSTAPIPDVQIILPEGPYGPRRTTISDANGHFIFNDVAPGRYGIVARRDGYFGAMGPQTPEAIITVSVAAGERTHVNSLKLTAVSTIRGRISDKEEKPISRAFVQALQKGYGEGVVVSWRPVKSVETNDRGEYTFRSCRRETITFGQHALPATRSVPDPRAVSLRFIILGRQTP